MKSIKVTCQSEFLKLKTVFIKNVDNAFVSDALVDKENYSFHTAY